MKKVFLLAAVAIMSASAFVSCGPSEEEAKKLADSLNALGNNLTEQMAKEMANDTAAATTTNDTAAATTTTEEAK